MSFEIENFQDDTLDGDYLKHLVDNVHADQACQLGKLWDYFRNPMAPLSGPAAVVGNTSSRPYVQAQEEGLPARITGVYSGSNQAAGPSRKEIVIENDIAWRVHTMVDFLFGQEPTIRSTAADPKIAAAVEDVVETMLQANGGAAFLQELALLGSVYGFVDVAVRVPRDFIIPPPAQGRSAHLFPFASDHSRLKSPTVGDANSTVADGGPGTSVISNASGVASCDAAGPDRDRSKHTLQARHLAQQITLETVEAPRVLPILDEDDYRSVRYWVQVYRKRPSRMAVHRRGLLGLRRESLPAEVEVIEITSARWWQRYEDRQLVDQGPNLLGMLPVVHIQNLSTPGCYEGLSDVEPLVPLQDELNTRLSDRANRVTYQSFKIFSLITQSWIIGLWLVFAVLPNRQPKQCVTIS